MPTTDVDLITIVDIDGACPSWLSCPQDKMSREFSLVCHNWLGECVLRFSGPHPTHQNDIVLSLLSLPV